MGLYRDWFLPRAIDFVMRREAFSELRQRVAPRVRGRVLEVGFGSGLNLPWYGEGVDELVALDPARVGRKLARERLAAAPFPVEFTELDGERYALDDASFDAVLSTWTLCSIPDLPVALREIRRVLRPGAPFVFLEHGLSPDPKIARRQRLFTPVQKHLAGGCRLDVDIAAAVRDAGFSVDELEQYTFPAAGRTAGSMYEGVARHGAEASRDA